MPEKKTKKPIDKKVKKVAVKKPALKKNSVASIAPRKQNTKKTSAHHTKVTEPKTNLTTTLAIVALLIVLMASAFLADWFKQPQTTKPSSEVKNIIYDCPDGQNALAALKENNLVSSQDSSVGAYVESINGNQNGDGSYWIYYINGEAGTIAPDQYTCKNGDRVEWRFEKLL